ncbi:MAG: hypothetical protein KF895_03150 [Parvibaculum sp.]|nr:hypothetical protein [Parvibaculum sp.]
MTPAQQRLFDTLVQAAVDGIRCPTNGELRAYKELSSLCRAGFVRSEVYEKNYRVVEITSGVHAGKRTAEHPGGRRPYRIIDKNGDQWVTRGKHDGAAVVRHVERRLDGGRDGPAPVTLPRLAFLEGNENDI